MLLLLLLLRPRAACSRCRSALAAAYSSAAASVGCVASAIAIWFPSSQQPFLQQAFFPTIVLTLFLLSPLPQAQRSCVDPEARISSLRRAPGVSLGHLVAALPAPLRAAAAAEAGVKVPKESQLDDSEAGEEVEEEEEEVEEEEEEVVEEAEEDGDGAAAAADSEKRALAKAAKAKKQRERAAAFAAFSAAANAAGARPSASADTTGTDRFYLSTDPSFIRQWAPDPRTALPRGISYADDVARWRMVVQGAGGDAPPPVFVYFQCSLRRIPTPAAAATVASGRCAAALLRCCAARPAWDVPWGLTPSLRLRILLRAPLCCFSLSLTATRPSRVAHPLPYPTNHLCRLSLFKPGADYMLFLTVRCARSHLYYNSH